MAVLFFRTFNAVYNPHWLVFFTIMFGSIHVVFDPFVLLATTGMFKNMWQQRRETMEVLRTFDVANVSRPNEELAISYKRLPN